MYFDTFTIRQWREGYTLKVEIGRPHNAPRYRRTDADVDRSLAADRKNQELRRIFPTLEEVFEEIKRLQIPVEERKS